MVALKHSDWSTIDKALGMQSGYVLTFSNPAFTAFFEEEFGIHIFDGKYSQNGPSKGKHMRAFIEVEDAPLVVRVLRRLWEYSEEIPLFHEAEGRDAVKTKFFDLLTRIEGGSAAPQTDVIERFRQDETLEELVAALQRDLDANRPAAAMDRLHTYCLIKFSHLLQVRGIACERSEPLNSRVAKYVNALQTERDLKEMTKQIIKNAISVFEKFNHIRNNRSLAHDNTLLDPAEARFIYDSIAAFLRFVKAIEPSRFGA
ncbi:abortive infection family protein [Azospirillum argentinense]